MHREPTSALTAGGTQRELRNESNCGEQNCRIPRFSSFSLLFVYYLKSTLTQGPMGSCLNLLWVSHRHHALPLYTDTKEGSTRIELYDHDIPCSITELILHSPHRQNKHFKAAIRPQGQAFPPPCTFRSDWILRRCNSRLACLALSHEISVESPSGSE